MLDRVRKGLFSNRGAGFTRPCGVKIAGAPRDLDGKCPASGDLSKIGSKSEAGHSPTICHVGFSRIGVPSRQAILATGIDRLAEKF